MALAVSARVPDLLPAQPTKAHLVVTQELLRAMELVRGLVQVYPAMAPSPGSIITVDTVIHTRGTHVKGEKWLQPVPHILRDRT